LAVAVVEEAAAEALPSVFWSVEALCPEPVICFWKVPKH
jgi:hypothetical protein